MCFYSDTKGWAKSAQNIKNWCLILNAFLLKIYSRIYEEIFSPPSQGQTDRRRWKSYFEDNASKAKWGKGGDELKNIDPRILNGLSGQDNFPEILVEISE